MNRFVIAAVSDLFFASKIKATAEHLGINVRFERSIQALVNSAKEAHPDLILVDLQSTNLDVFELAKNIQEHDGLRQLPLVGFYSHLQTELQARAKDSGFTHVMPRSAFTNKLADVLEGKL
jgi:CheY-like chemotaxis protein